MSDALRSPRVREAIIARLLCTDDVRQAVAAYAAGIAEILGGELVGCYLYGSLARGCFHPRTSDVDVLVVSEGPCRDDAVRRICLAHDQIRIPADAVFVTKGQIALDRTPTPVDFTIKLGLGVRPIRSPEGSRDFLLVRQEVLDCDMALVGRPAREVMRPVPWPLLAQALDHLLPNILPHFKNPALMLCRVAYAFANRSLCSKQAAGDWALAALAPRWHGMVGNALEKYRSGVADNQGPDEELYAFERYCVDYIANVRERP